MRKTFNFRSVMVIALVLIMCLTAFVACDKNKGNDQPDTSGLKSARDYVKQTYINSSESTAEDYTLIAQVKIGDVTYPIKWTVTITTEGAPADSVTLKEGDGKVTVDVNEQSTMDVAYTLTATVSDANGNSESVSFNRKVPKLQYADYATIKKACDENDKTTVYSFEGYIVGVNAAITSSYKSSSLGSMWVMDAQGHGLYVYNKYSSNSTIDSTLTTREAINEKYPFGAKVVVKGTVVKSYGVYEFNQGSTVTLTGKTAQDDNVTLDYVDRTELYSGSTGMSDATTLLPVQSTLVELKGVVLGAKGDSYGVKNYHFTLNGKDFIFYKDTYLVDDTTLSAIDAKWTIGATANIKGLVNVFSNKYQVYPMSADAVTIVAEATDEAVVDSVLSSLTVPTEITGNITLPTSTDVDKVEWSSGNANAVVDNATKLVTITRTNEDQPVKFTVSVTKGDVTKTKDFSATIKANEVVDPNTVIVTAESLGIVGKTYGDSAAEGVVINGVTFKFEELCENGKGIQTRNKTADGGKASKIWNTTAFARAIKEIVVTIYPGQYAYDSFKDVDVHQTFKFGTSKDSLTDTKTMGITKGVYTYTITPSENTFTYFSMEQTAKSPSGYFESIKVVYVDVKTDQELVDEAKAALELETKTTGVSFTLPTTGINGTTITWESSNTAVIAIDGANAVVTSPATETPVTLTATLHLNDATATKTFNVTVTVTIPEFNVTINQPENGGTLAVTINDEAFTGGKVQQGKTLVIVPIAVDANHELVAILVNGTKLDAVEGVYSVTVNDAAVEITATFREIKYATVTVNQPENGSVSVKVGEADVTTDPYRDGTVLTITATPASADYKLVEIKVNGTAITGTTYTIKDTDTAVVISATFAEKYPAMSIADFKLSDTAVNTEVKLTGIATAIDTKALYIQDADGQAVYIYYGNGKVPAGFVIGKEYTFTGKKAEYNGLIQLANPTKVVEKDAETVITAKVINDQAGYDALTLANSAELVTINGLVVKNGEWMIGDTVVAHWEGNALSSDSAAVSAIVALLTDGVSFNLVNVNVSVNSNKLQVIILKAEQVVIDWSPKASIDVANIGVGDTAQITVTADPAVTTDVKATFETENDQIATVDANGVVTGVATGTVAINVTANGHTVQVEVTVKATVDKWSVNFTKTVEGANGSIASVTVDGAEINTGDKVINGKTVTVTVTPDEGYQLASVTVGETAADTTVAGKTSFELTITADTTFTVAFDLIPVVKTNYSHTISSALKSGDQKLGDVTWNLTTDTTYFGSVDKTKGAQVGSGSNPAATLVLSTSELENFNKIVLNLSTASKASATVEVLVNGVSIGTKTLTTTATDYTFDLSAITSGKIEIKITQTTAKALYIKSIAVSEA